VEPLQAARDAVTNITATSGNKCARMSLLYEAKALHGEQTTCRSRLEHKH
jgi:hypothetical protein